MPSSSSSNMQSSVASFVMVLDLDGVQPVVVVVSSDASSEEEVPDDPYYPGTPFDGY